MTDDISPETRAGMEALLKRIAAEHHLDRAARDSLREKMWASFAGYVHGDGAVTEDEAFLLVREHFGNPAVIRAMFQDSRKRFSLPLFARWFIVAMIVYGGVTELSVWLELFTSWLFAASWDMFGMPMELHRNVVFFMMNIPAALMFLFCTLLLFAVLRRWRRSEERGGITWYNRLKLWQFLLLAAGLYCLLVLVVHVRVYHLLGINADFSSRLPRSTLSLELDFMREVMNYLFRLMFLGRYAAIFWWFDRRPRRFNLPAGLVALQLYGVINAPLWSLANRMFGWRSTFRFISQYFVTGLYSLDPAMLQALALYMAGAAYVYARRRFITTTKPVGVYND